MSHIIETMEQAIKRTRLGVVPFSTVVKGLRYTSSHYHPSRGTWYERTDAECFMSVHGLPNGPHISSFKGSKALHAELADPRELIYAFGERIGSLKLISWPDGVHSLLIRSAPPSSYFGDEWLAFVPTSEAVAAIQAASY